MKKINDLGFKFRCWDNISKKMHGWDKIKGIPLVDFELEHYSVMQWTGLKDKNGIDIYEGDILKSEHYTDKLFRVYFLYGGFVIKAPYWADTNDLIPPDELILESLSDVQTASYVKEQCEVMGNIHQNPELL